MTTTRWQYGLVLAVGLGLVARGHAAPALGEKPSKWEFAELNYWAGR